MPASQGLGAVVIGAGPYGLAAAAHLTSQGIEHRAFGSPMGGWSEHMPIGMFLKSTARDSDIGSPHAQMGLADWCGEHGTSEEDREQRNSKFLHQEPGQADGGADACLTSK